MGWLDNSTNNIILDAVLTDAGRQALAKNDRSFAVSKFALGDDEVNYGIIQKYGRTVGKEKIEKNTPVFEALTNQNLALKHRMLSISTPLVYLPQISIQGNVTSISLNTTTSTIQTFVVQLSNSNNDSSTSVNTDVADAVVDVYVPTLFLKINNKDLAPDVRGIDAVRTALTTVNARSTPGPNNEKYFDIKLELKTISSTTFQTFGRSLGGKLTISTFIRIIGQSSGQVLDVPVTITQQMS